MIEVIKAGALTTVQDIGRIGYRHLGVTQAGALDRPALCLANRLLSNPDNTPVLELTFGQSIFLFKRDAWIALTGADFDARIDNKPIVCGWRYSIKAGQKLSLRGGNKGMRAYVAVDGGVKVPLVMDSAATDLTSGIGGFHGRALEAGDSLTLGSAHPLRRQVGAIQKSWNGHIRALATKHTQAFSLKSQQTFWQTQWQLSAESNRASAILNGEILTLAKPFPVQSHTVKPGVIQVSASGQPLVLLADAKTTSNHPQIAVIIEADLWKLAQTRPGQTVTFELVDDEQAATAQAEWHDYFYRLQRSLG